MSAPGALRRRAENYGRYAEQLSRLALRLKGYRILESRLRTPMGEIDIVARRGDTLAIVEVKARGDWDTANEAVNARQRGRLARAAHAYLGANPQYAGYVLRFDVMLVTPWSWPRHVPDAWRA
ncbi:YraN family protein [Azospirillum brasilense]|uniref:YraN family protein n=1 Tax=Azospirillum brasilense TaxID=192 RepID=UPI00190CFA2B|nr:YraN family protein [Azospirillum brasilense]MBK3731805.1 YraN family protein [Azospirillum brasilense]